MFVLHKGEKEKEREREKSINDSKGMLHTHARARIHIHKCTRFVVKVHFYVAIVPQRFDIAKIIKHNVVIEDGFFK